jgi:hypothetical protein
VGKPRRIARALLVVFSGFYATKIGISPVYLAVAAGLALFAAEACLGRGRMRSSPSVGLLMLAFVWIAATQVWVEAPVPNVVNLLLGPCVYVALQSTPGPSPQESRRLAYTFIVLSLLLCGAEAAYRLTHPDYSHMYAAEAVGHDIGDLSWYAYKYSSFMYQDSNFVGLQLAALCALQAAIWKARLRFRWLMLTATLALLAASLSRASIVAGVAAVGWAWSSGRRWSRTAVIASAVVGASYVLPTLNGDGSFASKFEILSAFSTYVDASEWSALLLGVGAGQAFSVLGIGAHNILVTYVVELGLVSSLLLLFAWIAITARSRATVPLVVAMLVNGFSLTTMAVPYLYASAFLARELEVRGPVRRPSARPRPSRFAA